MGYDWLWVVTFNTCCLNRGQLDKTEFLVAQVERMLWGPTTVSNWLWGMEHKKNKNKTDEGFILKRPYVTKDEAVKLTEAVWVRTTKRWQSDKRFTSFITFLLAPENPRCQCLSELLTLKLTESFISHTHVVYFFVIEHDMYLKDFVVRVLLPCMDKVVLWSAVRINTGPLQFWILCWPVTQTVSCTL